MISRLGKKYDGVRAQTTPHGQVRVLVVGDSGVGKSSVVQLILHGKPIANPQRTVGCNVEVKHVSYVGDSSSSVSKNEADFFVELWDVSGHECYKDCRSIFYSQINGVIFVYDRSQKKTKLSLRKWATELASSGTFSAPMSSYNAAGVPVPYLVIGNKMDVDPSSSSGNLVDVARQWVGKQGRIATADELPVTESLVGGEGLKASAREGYLDLEAIKKFFQALIRRRYFEEGNAHLSLPTWTATKTIISHHARGRSLHDDDD